MKEVKFKSGEDLRFFHTLRSRVDAYFQERQLSKNANTTMVVKTVVFVGAYVLPFVAMLIFPMSFFIAMLLWLLMGWAKAGVGMSVMHDANHGAYSSNEKVNKAIGYVVNAIGGISANWKIQHNVIHHTYTNITGVDEDIDTDSIMRFSPHDDHKHIHKGQWWYAFFFYGISTLHWAVLKDFRQYYLYHKRGFLKKDKSRRSLLLTRLIAAKAVYFFVFFGVPALAGVPFLQTLIGFLIMHVTSGIILSVVFQLAHTVEDTEFPLPDKTGNMQDAWAVHQLRTTMNFACKNKLISWYVGGLNFQVEHHLFSKICHVHYPAIAPIVKKTAMEFGIPYLEKKTFGSAFLSHVRHLRTLGRTPLDEIMG